MERCALYIHIPFCRSKCRYCDFASYPHRENCWDSYLTAVLKEADEWQARMAGKTVPTVFFGGGTPTLLPPEKIVSLLEGLRARFAIADDAEITIEGNPGTVTLEGLRRLREAGFNRISFGAQAMEDRLLKGIGRIHTVSETEQAVALAREAGFDNLSLDLIYGLPGQSLDDWRLSLERATALSPEHISAYSLIVEEGTPLYDDVTAGKVTVPDDDQVVEMQRLGNRLLADKGYARYEISNYARTGRECRHNLTYWQRGDYLGLGVAAHSLFENERFEDLR
ncbi:MAG: radical SAM family heme chaperone HemW, partial [Clostridia bacterium]|nr:radical SAM family heme chaperone HemW [Clostridia bacterium]